MRTSPAAPLRRKRRTGPAHRLEERKWNLQWLENRKAAARRLKNEVYALYLASRDPRVPWYAQLLLAGVVAYALSPIDLIPDFIPVLGYLDDLILLPLGIYLALKLIPEPVMAECRRKAQHALDRTRPTHRWTAAAAIMVFWMAVGAALLIYLIRFAEF